MAIDNANQKMGILPTPATQQAGESPVAGEKELLAGAIGLTYPSNVDEVNTAVLVLSYLMARGMGGVMNIFRDYKSKRHYTDDFAKEIFIVRFRGRGDLYVNSKSVDPETGEPEYSLGTEESARLDLVEYKIRTELLRLIRENPTGIDALEQQYDAQETPSPFGWVNKIKVGYFNVLLGGKDRNKTLLQADKIKGKLDKRIRKLDSLPAEVSKDTISKKKI